MTRAALAFVALMLTAPVFAQCFAIDGDTLRCGHERVRIRGIDAPEMRDMGGPAARNALAEIIRGRSLEWPTGICDRYGRTLADVSASGRGWRSVDVGDAMIASGHAAPYVKRTTARACR